MAAASPPRSTRADRNGPGGLPAALSATRAWTLKTPKEKENDLLSPSRSRRVTNTLEYAGFLCRRAQKVISANYDSKLLGGIIFRDSAGFRDRTV